MILRRATRLQVRLELGVEVRDQARVVGGCVRGPRLAVLGGALGAEVAAVLVVEPHERVELGRSALVAGHEGGEEPEALHGLLEEPGDGSFLSGVVSRAWGLNTAERVVSTVPSTGPRRAGGHGHGDGLAGGR